MNQELGLRILGDLLEWRDEEAGAEYRWLRFMSRYKYDGYQDFVAGRRFIASLITWLKQFNKLSERRAAYAFVRKRLVYIGPAELDHLVRLTYPQVVRPALARVVAERLGTPEYLVWTHEDSATEYLRLLRRSLFVALSDGARIDAFRRANTDIISNEQVLIAPQIHESKWDSVLKELQREQGDEARFDMIFLLDDFTASGATLIREREDGIGWTGKLVRFWEDVEDYQGTHFAEDWTLRVHHYIGSADARRRIMEREAHIRSARGADDWFRRVEFTFGTVLGEMAKLEDGRDSEFLEIVDRYYDPSIETSHTDVGGGSVARGFGKCGLPIVLDHNTPNNSMAVLWAESGGTDTAPAMRPLFRRRQRHV